jgi:hypothetical protein
MRSSFGEVGELIESNGECKEKRGIASKGQYQIDAGKPEAFCKEGRQAASII